MPSKLDETRNFLRLYQYAAGESETPMIYHYWCAISLMAAVLEDRVGVEIIKKNPIRPNLYTFLIGPGGIGKGTAIDLAVRLMEESGINVRIFRGRVTYAYLFDILGKAEEDEYGRKIIPKSKLWLIMDELKSNIGSNKVMVDEFICTMTDAYTSTNRRMDTGTRTHGGITLDRPCINWLAGSTPVWLRHVLNRDVFESGFVARACFVFADYDFDRRIPVVKYPDDYDEVWEFLKGRLIEMSWCKGNFLMTRGAEAAFDQWFFERDAPEDAQIANVWKRQPVLTLKLAMLQSLAESSDMVIKFNHMVAARNMVYKLDKFAKGMINASNESQDTKPINIVEAYIKRKIVVGHSDLLRYARRRRGYDAKQLRGVIDNLVQEDLIVCKTSKTGGGVYEWKGNVG